MASARGDYTRFSHSTRQHQMECGSCHTFPSDNWQTARPEDAAFQDVTEYPQHASCLKCHRAQFFARERPAPKICSVCHTGVTPRFTARHPFPNPVESFLASAKGKEFVSAFTIAFPHDKHLELFGRSVEPAPSDHAVTFVRASMRVQEAPGATSCVNCHETYQPRGESGEEYASKPPEELGDGFWLKKGTFKTSPGHATCFNCHSLDSGMKPDPTDCAICHKLAAAPAPGVSDFDPKLALTMTSDPVLLRMWRARDASATFPHDGGLHTEVACSHCHDVATMDTTDRQSRRVRMQSCGGDLGCHITATVDEGGALTYEIAQRKEDAGFRCTKCHLGYAASAIPASHTNAVAGGKSE